MKNLILITFLVVGLFAKAQQTELIQNNWYLTKVLIESEEFFPPPYDAQIGINYFTKFENENYFYTNGCNTISADINDLNDSSFTLFDANITQMECEHQEFDDFDGRYFSLFWDYEGEDLFQYEIIDNIGVLSLIITNPSGNKAYYENQHLSIQEFNMVDDNFLIVIQDNLLYVKIINSTFNPKTISIYDLNGRLILRSEINNEKVFVGQIPNSIYIVQIEDINGNFYSKKVMKK